MWLLPTVLIAAIVAGCGGEDDAASSKSPAGTRSAATTTEAPATKAEFLRKANAACEREGAGLTKEVAEFLKLYEDKPSAVVSTELGQVVMAPVLESEAEAIRLTPMPPGDEKKIDEILFAAQLTVDGIATTLRITSFEALERRFAKVRKMFRAYGLASCAKPPKRIGALR